MPTHAPFYLTGPTAVGKSAVAMLLAERMGGEIISVDSMQVYRGLDLGTAKPSPAERARVPHHLVDVCHLQEDFNAARFVELAGKAVADLQRRGRVPIFCGGTGLYFKAWLEGLAPLPPPDPALRAELEATPLEVLLAELEQKDPATFARVDRRNPRRVVRAVEIWRLSGRPMAEAAGGWTRPAGPEIQVFALRRSAEDLRRRIEERVDAMFRAGLVEETRRLLAAGLAQNRTAMQAIGYRQVVEYLRGERDLPATVALVKQRTWQFARRQMTYLRHQLPVVWVDWPPEMSAETLADQLLARWMARV
ncbi:tRNA (adenosine(37)-N6)-dimethylallyltransferase MiaA [Fontisphaera persica]|uniref:tRNA (adenosine(37)-N6)-dimethylallyltransferase MiaA n=1 Tax=Fontisphaera persica TaxID=2974023 RepID=UPI0024C061B2|nr:tRNA (adenosine(37)-N6)-dimethylallyltransferase MiaA [Fontisphaera persica]WCJ58288.1 tRNA (adenosine(37)-N6)-dimethylallyltransferase MiaA [Fontisphaera persica]